MFPISYELFLKIKLYLEVIIAKKKQLFKNVCKRCTFSPRYVPNNYGIDKFPTLHVFYFQPNYPCQTSSQKQGRQIRTLIPFFILLVFFLSYSFDIISPSEVEINSSLRVPGLFIDRFDFVSELYLSEKKCFLVPKFRQLY